MCPDHRADAAARGRLAEDAAAAYLEGLGYVLLDRNVRLGHLEIDIVAKRGSVVAVVEVRHRGPTSWQSAFESITPTKQRRLRRAANRLWRERFARDPSIERIRFDVAAVDFIQGRPVVEYVEGAI